MPKLKRKSPADFLRQLAAEGMPENLPRASPRPTIAKDWYNLFGGEKPLEWSAYAEATERLASDAQSTLELFSQLTNILYDHERQDRAWARANGFPAPETDDDLPPPLTEQEAAILEPFCDGLSTTAIAERLGIGRQTVRTRLKRIGKRYGITIGRMV